MSYKYHGLALPVDAYNEKNGYFSLHTGKFVKGITRDGHHSYKVTETGPFIYGNDLMIQQFLDENKSVDLVCHINKAEAFVLPDGLVDVEKFPTEMLSVMCDFHFEGLNGKGRIIDVIDGDTVRMLVYIELLNLAQGLDVKIGRQSKAHHERRYPIVMEQSNKGFFTVLKVRLFGIDAAEKNTTQGQLAKKLMSEKYAETNNIVYYHLYGMDKYGRTLADLYTDAIHTVKLNEYLISKDFGSGPLVVSYTGGTKSEYMKSLTSSNIP